MIRASLSRKTTFMLPITFDHQRMTQSLRRRSRRCGFEQIDTDGLRPGSIGTNDMLAAQRSISPMPKQCINGGTCGSFMTAMTPTLL